MNAFTIEFPSICIRALLLGYSTCGGIVTNAMYPGNYYWASCNHVAALPGLWNPLNNAFDCESFIFNVSNSWGSQKEGQDAIRGNFPFYCAYGVLKQESLPDFYADKCRYSRWDYIHNIYNHLIKFRMPRSVLYLEEFKDRFLQFLGEPCLSVRSDITKIVPYMDRASWHGPDLSKSEQ